MLYIKILAVVIAGYLIGSISSAILVGKFKGIDIRTKGSGNAGATNVTRVLGKKLGVVVFLIDFFKGVIACLVGFMVSHEVGVVCGFAAILGHNFPIYFGFRGGKGVSTSFGVILCLDWRIALILGTLELIMISTVKIVSVSSLTVFALLPVVTLILNMGTYYSNVIVTILLAILVFWRHRENISRLINGTENKFGQKRGE